VSIARTSFLGFLLLFIVTAAGSAVRGTRAPSEKTEGSHGTPRQPSSSR
jgi:hypothetical protein